MPGIFIPVFRLGITGNIEQLLPTGAWGEPEGDYEIPPVPARPEPTPSERECLAAANAEFVLRTLYETVSDAIADGLDEAETIEALAIAIAALIGAWGGLIVTALIALALAAFHVFLEIAEFMTVDFWTETFSDKLVCVLLGCASSDGDVVYFDFDCVVEGTAEAVQSGDEDFLDMIRLFGQVRYLLSIIGADGLNAAGATTAVETADCEYCEEEWSACFDFLVSDGEWEVAPCYTATQWTVDGWGRTENGIVGITREFPSARITSFGIVLDQPLTGNYHRMFWVQDGHVCTDTSTEVDIDGNTEWGVFGLTGYTTSLELVFQNGTPNTSYPLDYHVVRVNINGIGFNPFEDYPPCEE